MDDKLNGFTINSDDPYISHTYLENIEIYFPTDEEMKGEVTIDILEELEK